MHCDVAIPRSQIGGHDSGLADYDDVLLHGCLPFLKSLIPETASKAYMNTACPIPTTLQTFHAMLPSDSRVAVSPLG